MNMQIKDTQIVENPDEKILNTVGLTQKEYARLCEMIKRKPTLVEMGMVGALWSEHCGYKSSKIHLKKLPVEGERVLQGPGENAGVVKINEEVAAVFKIESHNHPSAVEPFHGSATGVGGIIRDVFSMGAKPIALLDPLRFGPITRFFDHRISEDTVRRNRYLVSGVVGGISFYGNCVGIPTVGGETYFHECYSANPLMNGLCLGVVKADELIHAVADKAEAKLVLVGAKTGRDGIQGATFASVELEEDVQASRPAVQVGDPFLEKCLLEATLALRNNPSVLGVQDLGAAGLTSSSAEMAARGKKGVVLHLDKVPLRAQSMTAYEIMLSESQERMLMVVEPEGLEQVYEEFRKWGLDASVVGEVTDDGEIRAYMDGNLVARLPVDVLVNSAPVLDRERKEGEKVKPSPVDERIARDFLAKKKLPADFPSPVRCRNTEERGLCLLLSHPNNASKRSLWITYDYQVQDNTVLGPEMADASVLRLKGFDEGLALTTDGPSQIVAIEPYNGAIHAIKEAYLNVLCTGAEPIAYTNCLNFANPEVPEVMDSFAKVVEGMAEASRALATPVVSGNVSFYNETKGSRILPTSPSPQPDRQW